MNRQEAKEEYSRALRLGQREYRELGAAGKNPYPAVLDELLANTGTQAIVPVGLLEIPTEQIIGTKSAGRVSAFTAGFLPLLDFDSEFSLKWVELCAAHLSDTGIRDPIVCFEYLGSFYVQEGNKRVSVLKYFGAPRIPAMVSRILPEWTEEPRIRAYREFLDFFKVTGLYQVQFRHPGEYTKLLAALGKTLQEEWSDREKTTFSAYFQYFREAFDSLGLTRTELRPEEALLLWLEVYPFRQLGKLSTGELRQTLHAMKKDLLALSQPDPVKVETAPANKPKPGILGRFISAVPEHLNVAFVHQQDAEHSTWIKGHELGREHLQRALPQQVTTRAYFHADDAESAAARLEQAVSDGADVIFTTVPQLSRATLKAALKYPNVRFLNCSVDVPYSSIRTYYSRIYEGKFVTGAIAGAMADGNRIGYVASNPIYGVPASINAFALGAQMTNPRASVELRWSCQSGSHVSDLIQHGIRIISNRDVPTQDGRYLDFGNYGTYQVGNDGKLTPLASPCWLWGKFYENVVRTILGGAWSNREADCHAVNYWWGMDSGVIDVKLSEHLPEGVRVLAEVLCRQLRSGTLDPFRRRIVAQDGSVKNDGSRALTADELLHMDWLCQNIHGSIPLPDQLLPFAQPIVRELGIYRDRPAPVAEGCI